MRYQLFKTLLLNLFKREKINLECISKASRKISLLYPKLHMLRDKRTLRRLQKELLVELEHSQAVPILLVRLL